MRVSLYRIFLIITDLIKFIIVTNFFNAYLFKSKKTHRFGPVHDTAANLTISFFLFSRYIDILSEPYYTSNNITANALRLDTRTGISQFFFLSRNPHWPNVYVAPRFCLRGHLKPVLNPHLDLSTIKGCIQWTRRWAERGKSSPTTHINSIACCKAITKFRKIISNFNMLFYLNEST